MKRFTRWLIVSLSILLPPLLGCADAPVGPSEDDLIVTLEPLPPSAPPPAQEMTVEGVEVLAPFSEVIPAPAGLAPTEVFLLGDLEALSMDGADLYGVKREIAIAIDAGKPFSIHTDVFEATSPHGEQGPIQCLFGPQYAKGSGLVLQGTSKGGLVVFTIWANALPTRDARKHCGLYVDVANGAGGFTHLVTFDIRQRPAGG